LNVQLMICEVLPLDAIGCQLSLSDVYDGGELSNAPQPLREAPTDEELLQ